MGDPAGPAVWGKLAHLPPPAALLMVVSPFVESYLIGSNPANTCLTSAMPVVSLISRELLRSYSKLITCISVCRIRILDDKVFGTEKMSICIVKCLSRFGVLKTNACLPLL
uniref:Uncharacterized protein n=1 Tax=Chelonoidis abingdonii TaxID=106734 RepID=A0A8C0G2T1_CHEAB